MGSTKADHDLAEALLKLGCVLDGIRHTVSRELGLTPQQSQLLSSLTDTKPTHGELAELLHCDKTNITGLVDRLERRELVRRELSTRDRRATQVVLTPQGARLAADFRAALTTTVADRLDSWPRSRRAELATLARSTGQALNG